MWKIRCHGAAQRRQTWSAGTVSFVRRLLRLLGWRGLVNVFVLVAFFTALVVRRSDLRRAAAELGEVDVRWVVLLIGMTLLRLLTQGFYTAAVTPGIGLRQGIAVHEVTTGANNTIVGSGLISTGLRIAMLRSWPIWFGSSPARRPSPHSRQRPVSWHRASLPRSSPPPSWC
jgi:hypothetical protein